MWIIDIILLVQVGDVGGGVDQCIGWNLVIGFIVWVEVVQCVYVIIMGVVVVQVDGQFVDGGGFGQLQCGWLCVDFWEFYVVLLWVQEDLGRGDYYWYVVFGFVWELVVDVVGLEVLFIVLFEYVCSMVFVIVIGGY